MDYFYSSGIDLDSIDESTLKFNERLGLAYCRLNCWQWDEIIGTKPEGFDDLPDCRHPSHGSQGLYKEDFVTPACNAIASILGSAQCSRYWWRFKLGRSDAEWVQWYIQDRIRVNQIRNRSRTKGGWITRLLRLRTR